MNKKVNTNNDIAEAIRGGSFAQYQEARYPRVQEGSEVIFTEEDFTNVDFSIISVGFFVFDNCKLSGAHSFRGLPITIKYCDARKIDLRGVYTVIYANDSDFRGLQFSKGTVLGVPEDGSFSIFTNCKVDDQVRQFFEKQGVVFK
jgi:hypothetical protein